VTLPRALTASRRRAILHGLVISGLLLDALVWSIGVFGRHTVGADAFAYWSLDIAHPYTAGVGAAGAFLYSPVIARLFAPAVLLSWPVFWWLWTALLVGTTIWLGWTRAIWLLAFPPVAFELYYGNVNLLLAAAIALGFRYPVAWSFVLLTKVTPGIGLLWFAVRREWRKLALALGATAVLVAVSLLVDRPLWQAWIDSIANAGAPANVTLPIPLWIRLPIAAAVVIWGARTDRAWTVPVAATVALPVLWPATSLAVLAAIPALLRPDLRPSPIGRPSPAPSPVAAPA
jgi:hypothetical protein